jgi:YVTN family beta-propeller protein
VGSDPGGVDVDGATDTVYVANYGSGTVSVIDGATNAVSATVTDSSDPDGVAVDETTDTIYATNPGSGTVSVIIPVSLSVLPATGPAGTSVAVTGRGFAPGETVRVTYKTGIASPKSVTICTTTALSDSSVSCLGAIPPRATAGARGAHKMVAKGLTSLIKVKITFTLT